MQKSDWKKCKLGDTAIEIIDGDRGKQYPKNNELLPDGFCLFLSTKNLPDIRFDFSETQFISKEKDCALRKGKLQRNDIAFTTRGTLGHLAWFTDAIPYENIRINSGMVILRNQDCGIDTRFLFQQLASQYIQKQIAELRTGSAQPQLPIKDFLNLELYLPPLEEQKRIAQILGALDDKIELLQKQNKTLEDMAKAIFKSWFVDFDVVHAKQKGLSKADIMREYHLTDELYDLFPSDFENSSLGPIPLGWQATTFKTITTQEKTRVGSQELPVLSAVKTGELVLSEDFFNKKVFSNSIKNYIVVPRLSFAYNPSRINIGSIGCNHMNSAGCVSPVYVVFSVISGYENYMEFIIHSTSFNSEVAHRASGTVRQSLSYQDLSYIPVIKPSKDIISMFDTLISYWQRKQILNNKQIQTLTELRDTLLPPLISGKIRV